MRFRLRTLMIVLALGPPVLAVLWPEVVRRYEARAIARRQAQQIAAIDGGIGGLMVIPGPVAQFDE